MALVMKVVGKKTKSKARESRLRVTEPLSTMESGLMIKSMAKEFSFKKVHAQSKVFGKMEF